MKGSVESLSFVWSLRSHTPLASSGVSLPVESSTLEWRATLLSHDVAQALTGHIGETFYRAKMKETLIYLLFSTVRLWQ